MNNLRKYITLSIAVLMLTATGCSNKNTADTEPQKKEESSLKNIVTGTGVLEAEEQLEVFSGVMGEVISAPFSEGQYVQKGDILYKIDQKDILNNISKARLGIEKSQLSYNQNEDNIKKLSVRSNLSGTITNLYINNGDMLMANARVADIVNDDIMVLKVPFIDETASSIYVGQSASVTIVGSFFTVDGTVKKITSGHMVSNGGNVIKIIEIDVKNPGTLKKGDKGTAVIGYAACNDEGTFDYSESGALIAEVGGKVVNLGRSVGDHITKGSIVTTLENDTFSTQQQQNSLAIKEAKLTLENLNNQLSKYNITSTINGVAIKKTVDKGDQITAANMSKMAVIADLSKIIFKMNVDELDVNKISEGQRVTFTADAAPETEFSGVVEFISASGTVVNGVSLYEIKVSIENPEGLMPGMNVNAKIET